MPQEQATNQEAPGAPSAESKQQTLPLEKTAAKKDFRSPDSLEGADPELAEHIHWLRDQNAKQRVKLREVESEAASLKAQKEESDRKAREEQGQYKELYEKEKTARAEAMTKASQKIARAELRAYAVQEGLIDRDIVDLISLDKVQVDEAGNVAGVEEAVTQFKASKPHFFRSVEAVQVPAPAQSAPAAQPNSFMSATGSKVTPRPSEKPSPTDVKHMDKKAYELYKKEQLAQLRAAGR